MLNNADNSKRICNRTPTKKKNSSVGKRKITDRDGQEHFHSCTFHLVCVILILMPFKINVLRNSTTRQTTLVKDPFPCSGLCERCLDCWRGSKVKGRMFTFLSVPSFLFAAAPLRRAPKAPVGFFRIWTVAPATWAEKGGHVSLKISNKGKYRSTYQISTTFATGDVSEI